MSATRHRYTVSVSREDINEGVRGQSAHCMVATAIGRTIEDATRIAVDAQVIRFSIGKERLTYLTPRNVAQYVIHFDAGDFDKIVPLTVELANPIVAERRPKTATRLIVKGGPEAGVSPKPASAPSRTRAWGQRVFRVNQQKEGA